MADSITAQIKAVLQQYASGLEDDMLKLSKSEASKTAKDLNQASAAFEATGHTKTPYSKSWTSKQDGAGYTVYSKVAGLPHLLEHGHVVISHGAAAGSAPGRVHIQPVTDWHVIAFEEKARKLVGK